MKYDFETRVDRSGTGSEKWEAMYAADPTVGRDVVPLSVADMEFPEPPEVISALHSLLDHSILGYTGPTDSFYDAVVGWQRRRHGWTPEREWIVTSPGVVPAFFNAIRALTRPGEGIIIQPPVYYPFKMAIERNDRAVVDSPLRLTAEGTYEIDYDDLESKAANPNNKILLFCSPHNPVGRVWTPEELRRVVDICLAHDVFVISDEIHDDLIMPGFEHTTIMNVMQPEEWDRCIVCTAPSKTFNLAGCQCSTIFIPDEHVRKLFKDEFAKAAISELNVFAYTACTAAYNEGEGWLDQLIQVIQANHDLVCRRMAESLPEARAFSLEGTYLQWIDLTCLGMGREELERFMQHDARLFLDEGYLFGDEGEGFERVNLACPTAVLDEALDRFFVALSALSL